jgi:uncharacterized protein (DUF1778 family)
MAKERQLSAVVSAATMDLLDRHVRATGVKKQFVVEAALRHHLIAVHELPADVVIHPRVVVTRASMTAIAERLENPNPTAALRELMSDGD